MPECGESLTQGIPLMSRRRFDGFAAPRWDAHVHGTFTHEQTKKQDERYGESGQNVGADAPALVFDQRAEHGQKYELTGSITRGENANYRAAIFHKPAVSHRRAERQSDRTGADPDKRGADQQLPDRTHASYQQGGTG